MRVVYAVIIVFWSRN